MKRLLLVLCFLAAATAVRAAKNPVAALVDRIDKGASAKFSFEVVDPTAEKDYFELSSRGGKIVVRGNNWVSVAAGLNWYLKYHAGVHIAWNNPRPKLDNLPKVPGVERYSTDKLLRYYLNYCTVSYSMAFWGWERWQQEIDWMALHGINMPLAVVGTSTVWRNTMLRMGYTPDEVNRFVAGPAHQAWWLMNNLEGWGGPNPDSYYANQAALEQKILAEYRAWGIEPVMAGYAGMVPSFAPQNPAAGMDLQTQDPGTWCSYQRPAFLQPSDPRFEQVAKIYYEELEKLYGKAHYYAIDPFHEGGSIKGVDLKQAGTALFGAMRAASPGSVWVVQSWQRAPYKELIDPLPRGGVVVLDLQAEERPQWGDAQSPWFRKDGFWGHDWIYCMLLNFGANEGLYGKMQRVIDGYYLAKESRFNASLVGVGATMEGIENNPVMYELIYELPWRADKFTKSSWIENWVLARYGRTLPQTLEAWKILSTTAYDVPAMPAREGTNESVFCARPALEIKSVSSWGTTVIGYDTRQLERALQLMVSVAERYRGCNNFEYDLVDVARQALANRGQEVLSELLAAFDKGERNRFFRLSERFVGMISLQDSLLNSRSEFMVGRWLDEAKRMGGKNKSEIAWYEWNARTLITTWGNRTAANQGGLRDYSHRQWGGLTKDFYLSRWKYFFDYVNTKEQLPVGFDYYDMEEAWTQLSNSYPTRPLYDPIEMATQVERFLRQ